MFFSFICKQKLKIIMKKLIQFATTMLVITGLVMPVSLLAQDKDAKLMDDSKEAKAASLNQIP
jgi:hypothetical protein